MEEVRGCVTSCSNKQTLELRAVLNARAAANTDAEAERQSKYASQMQAVRERAAGQRPKALDRFVATPEPRPKEAMGL